MADEELTAKYLPQVISTLREMSEKVSEIDRHVGKLLEKITSRALATKKGVSFLELKFHLLLSYIIDVVYYVLIKTNGEPWQGHPAVERLVEARTVMEKLRPIDQKMKYQIDKLIKTATTGLTGSSSYPLKFKPNPDNMATKLEDEESESSDEGEQKKAAIYVPPKVSAVPYDEDFDKKSRKQRDEEKARKRALNSSLLQDLRDEYSEAPQEIRDESVSWARKRKEQEEEEERTRYEEENMLRLPAKKMKKVSGRVQSDLDELTSFTDLSALNMGEGDGGLEYSRRSSSSTGRKAKTKKKGKFASAKKKKGFMKRRRR